MRTVCFRSAVKRPGMRGTVANVGVRKALLGWPVVRQLTGADPLARGAAAQSAGGPVW